MTFWVGGFGPREGGGAAGVGRVSPSGGGKWAYQLAAEAPSPSWLTAHPRLPVLYACLEGDAAVQAFRVGPDLEPLGPPVAVGDGPCHLTVIDDAAWVSCWGDGSVDVLPIGPDGSLGAGSKLTALPPHPGRRSRAHMALATADGSTLTIDMGLDVLRWWRGEAVQQTLSLAEGSGPRHAVESSPGVLHVVTELSCEVVTLVREADGWRVAQSLPLGCAAPGTDDFASGIVAAGASVFVAVRGCDRIFTLRPTLDGVAIAGSRAAGVAWPRFLGMLDGGLVVAGERSDEIVVADPETGAEVLRVAAPTPTAVATLGAFRAAWQA